ncbi:MAG: hypothetical protein N0E37_04810 [Candidatus Thiodiazotropha taylori]|nr:hypothetical protein [Candidatus Thiodiazotropha taylori]RLW54208.1 MAG: hypothetical protein B6D76_08545 [gamma proteobacterium symbiont of Stewartia floridana]MCG7958413.1 hypothetical protein [Candidatus Thiodiazotropha taylori]MCW4231974.1 hypothetical protein [Candidatus Thiodiazotropha taylori]MCW4243740.1 hypothetical protein [Candidatus Thiodiazotropha taylori]
MIEISSLSAMIIAEVMLGLVILSGLLLLFTLLRKQRIRKAAHHLAERVQADKEKRTERLKKLLAEQYQLQSPQLDQTLHGIVQTEMTLYQNMLNGFLKDDQVYLQQIDVDVENLVLAYQALAGNVSGAGGSDDVSSDEVEALKAENERLAEELKVTMDTMGRMLNEYSTMFADGDSGFPAEATAVAGQEASASSDQVQSAVAEATAEPASAEAAAVATEIDSDDDMVIPDMTEEELTESSLSELEEESVETEIEEAVEAVADSETSAGDVTDIETPDVEASAADRTEAEIPEVAVPDVEIPEVEIPEVEIPDVESLTAGSTGVDEEVSEIIDEVMEIADDMMHETAEAESQSSGDAASDTEAEASDDANEVAEQSGESMVDDLNAIDIEIPEMDSSEVEQAEFEPGSLEEEWAKLLEEESSDEEKKES